MSVLVLCCHSDPEFIRRLHHAINAATEGHVNFQAFADSERLFDRALTAVRHHPPPALIFCGAGTEDSSAITLISRLHEQPMLRPSRKVLIGPTENSLAGLLRKGAIHGLLDQDFTAADLDSLLWTLLGDFLRHEIPELGEIESMALGAIPSMTKRRLLNLHDRLEQVESSVIGADGMSDDQVESTMIAEFDRVLGNPPRSTYPPGEVIVREGDDPGSIWIILEGQVKLFRTLDGEDLTFHSESAGRIVGLMSLSLQNPIFFSCRAVNAVTALCLSRQQITDAIHRSPVLSNCLITVILRSMARRNRRAAQLLTQVRTLNKRLSTQRDELSSTLDALKDTQRQLVESAKMATLGNLAAGMAHELNNPVAAIISATVHLRDDLLSLLTTGAEPEIARHLLTQAAASALSTREERQLRDVLAAQLDIPPARAARLVAAGVHDETDFLKLAHLAPRTPREHVIEQIDRAGQIATALRNIENCSQRIAALVRSLKTHARQDDVPHETTDLHTTLEDVLLILANRLKATTVIKEYAQLPPIQAHPGQLQQVWTNLITNAVQAMDGKGTLVIRSSLPDAATARIEIEDHGCGIPEEIASRLFETRFTTKGGRIEFGLGLGLPIARNLIRQHGGDIHFTSRPGLTVFTIDLPLSPPSHPSP